MYGRSQFEQTILALKILPTLGAILRSPSTDSDVQKTITQTYKMFAINSLLHHQFTFIGDVEDGMLIKELLATLAEVVALGQEPAIQLQCACLMVYIYSKCKDYSFTSDFYHAWRVCKRMGMVEKALADPSLVGTETENLPC